MTIKTTMRVTGHYSPLALLLLFYHSIGIWCFSGQEKSDTEASFNRNFTGVYFDPVEFAEYNGIQHNLKASDFIGIVNTIHTQFDQLMVAFHLPQKHGRNSSNDMVLETVAERNALLNESSTSSSSSLMKVIILCKFNDWDWEWDGDMGKLDSLLFPLGNVISKANSIFSGTVTAIILEMPAQRFQSFDTYRSFRKYFIDNGILCRGCRYGLQMSLQQCGESTGFPWRFDDFLGDDIGSIDVAYFSDFLSSQTVGVPVEENVNSLTKDFTNCRDRIGSFNLDKEIETGFMVTFSDVDVEGQDRYSKLVKFWNGMDNWAEVTDTPIIILQAFDTPFDSEEEFMKTNGWWRLIPKTSYFHSSELLFENKISLINPSPDNQSESVNMTWLRQDPQFSREKVGVVVNPFVLQKDVGNRVSQNQSSLTALIQQVSRKFSKISISIASKSGDADWYLNPIENNSISLIPELVAGLNSNGGGFPSIGIPLEVLLTFDETTVETAIGLAIKSNQKFKGTISHLIYFPSEYGEDTLLTGLVQIARVRGKFRNFALGIVIKMEACQNLSHFLELMDLLKEYFYFFDAKFIYISADVTPEYLKLGSERVVSLFTVLFENCRNMVNDYFSSWGKAVDMAIFTEWPFNGEEKLDGLVQFVKFWEGMHDWAVKTDTSVIFSSAFDAPAIGISGSQSKAKYGWWKLLENDTFPESIDDYKFEDKREAAWRVAPGKPKDDPVTPINPAILAIPAVFFVIFLIVALLTIRHLLKTRKSKYLTREDIAEFFNGGDSISNLLGGSAEGVNGPYNKEEFELPKDSFVVAEGSLLGSGAFGKVCRATVQKRGEGVKDVAVKMTKVPSPRSAFRGLLYEIKILSYLGKHPHVVELIGAYTEELKKGKALVFIELCAMGSLESYLRKRRNEIRSIEEGHDMGTFPIDESLTTDMYRWSGEIANGMEFVTSKHIVHLDIASRNVLLTADKRAKITDFGLSRRMYDCQSYIKKNPEPLPFRWMSPESLRRSQFTEKSDVWSFGVLLWEIYSLGDEPYPGLTWDASFVSKLEKGLIPGQPTYNCNNMYSVMLLCWAVNPDRRPTFSDLAASLFQKSTLHVGYQLIL